MNSARKYFATCNATLTANEPEARDWGVAYIVSDELTALRIVYANKHNPYGYKIEKNDVTGIYLVTVFNRDGERMGLNN